MIINHNLNALNAHRNLAMNTVAAGKSMEKLSSGLRINRAGDDAAGLAISEKMRAQIRGLDQAARNAQDAISMIQTAEGALNETHSILQRMRELAVQAGNDTNTSTDRSEIQKELNQLTSEINRIGNTTEFNKQKLLNASSGTITNAVDASSWEKLQNATNTGIKYQGTYTGNNNITLTLKWDNTNKKYQYSTDGTNFTDISWTGSSTTIMGLTLTKPEITPDSDKTDTINLTAAVFKSSFTMQVGANENQTITLEFSDMRASALGLTGTGSGYTSTAGVTDGTNNTANENGLDVSSAANAAKAIQKIQTAIDTVSAERSKLGAYQNRLEHTINNLGTSSENLTAAESRIRDVDMAKEMMAFSKNNILAQAAQAMLAQANQQPQGVLQLLR